jgi:hypothetical protein
MQCMDPEVVPALAQDYPERVLYGGDWAGEDGMLSMAAHLALMKGAVPLEPEGRATTFGHVAPYMTQGR